MNEKLRKYMLRSLGILSIVIGVLFIIYWYASTTFIVCTYPGACTIHKYPGIYPYSLFLVGFILIVMGIISISWNFIKNLNKNKIMIFLIILTLISVGLCYSVSVEYYPEPVRLGPYAMLYFRIDQENNTLTVNDMFLNCGEESDYVWENIIINGNATKPKGSLDLGDTLTNCSGKVRLIWEPREMVIFYHDFDK